MRKTGGPRNDKKEGEDKRKPAQRMRGSKKAGEKIASNQKIDWRVSGA